MIENRQSYCNEKGAVYFGPLCRHRLPEDGQKYTSLFIRNADSINTNQNKTNVKNLCDIGGIICKAAPGGGIFNIKPFNAI